MTTTKRLTKAQKQDLAKSEVKALAGHHQAVTAPAIVTIENEQIASDSQTDESNEFKPILRFILAGGIAAITGDLKRGFTFHHKGNQYHQHGDIAPMVDAGLLVLTERPHHLNSLYRLAVSQKGRDLLNVTIDDVQEAEQSF